MQENKDLSRGKGNHVSKQVFDDRKATFKGDKFRIMQIIDGNICTKEIANKMKKDLSQISGRFTWLKINGYIFEDKQVIFNGNPYTVYCLTEKGLLFNVDFNS